ncbi:MAG: hypothetical protein GF364_09180 [Candidatus Lokiarchaeota archaeon]|nr:hypothetical protein [Candidatus Lokiarchaeota archaeon]
MKLTREQKKKHQKKKSQEKDDAKYEKFKEVYLKKSGVPDDRYSLIKMIGKMIDHHVKKVNLKVKIPNEVYFRCNNCGKCCDHVKFRIPITLGDCAFWLKSNKEIYLRALDHNRGHPKNLFYFITKRNFDDHMIENYGEEVYNDFLVINPSLKKIDIDEEQQCVFFNSQNNKCTIYSQRPVYCQIYPYQKLFDLNSKKLYTKAYRKVSKMRLKNKEFVNFIKNGLEYRLFCPEQVLEESDDNLRRLKQHKWESRITQLIIEDLFSCSLYFQNRRDILEKVMYSLFSKDFQKKTDETQTDA